MKTRQNYDNVVLNAHANLAYWNKQKLEYGPLQLANTYIFLNIGTYGRSDVPYVLTFDNIATLQ